MVTIGSAGDVRPFILLGKALKKRGHSITIASFYSFSEDIHEAGLSFFSLSGDAESFISDIMSPDTNAVTYLPRVFKNLHSIVPDMLHDLEESCRNADAMICNFFGSVYYSIAEKFDIPCVQTHFYPMDQTSSVPISSVRNQSLGPAFNKSSYKFGYYAIGTLEKILLSEWRKESNITNPKVSVNPMHRIGNHQIPVIYAISPAVFPRPSEWPSWIHMSGFWFDPEPCSWEPPQSLQDFLSEGEPPVYIGFGSMRAGNMNKLLTMLLRAVRAAGLRAVICGNLAKWYNSSGRRVYFAKSIPHDWLFPRMKAVIHHGGAGTTSAGLRWGCPSWILPFAGDQPFWGAQVYRIGCGPKPLPRENVSVRKLTQGLIDLTTRSEYKKNAASIAARLSKESGTETAADLAERLISEW